MTPDAARARFETLAQADASAPLAARFAHEPDRLERLCLEAPGLYLDVSKQTWSLEGFDAGAAFVRAAGLDEARARLFAGEAVNASEGRAVLHMALRAETDAGFSALGQPISAEVDQTRRQMAAFARAVRSGERRAADGGAFDTILHIGIGGSDLGPRLVWSALRPLSAEIDLRFVANLDGGDLAEALTGLDARRTLCIVVSKTFTTQETLANATAVREWLAAAVDDAAAHLVGVSAAPERARDFGCGEVFGFADWVGGRFSTWSAVGLSVAIALGWETFDRLLAGARAMDEHFLTAPPERSAPVVLALAQAFNVAAGRTARAVVPYAHRLRLLPAYLQQLEMESNGKRVGVDGRPVGGPTCPVVFGEPGSNSQHAFFQMLHQGPQVTPVEFLIVADNPEGLETQAALNANALAQAEALMNGKSLEMARAELLEQGVAMATVEVLAPQKTFPGDRPSSMLVLERLDAESLGALMALYEHKTFVEGILWGLNSFDQWGVELGKAMARAILPELEGGRIGRHDPSTASLIRRLSGRTLESGGDRL